LADRAAGRLRGEHHDPFADLRTFVERYWPEHLTLAGRAGSASDPSSGPSILINNPAPVSRYLSALELDIDGSSVDGTAMWLVNATPGETGVAISSAALGPERGFYVRRMQTAELSLPGAIEPGSHRVNLRLGLAGVTNVSLTEMIEFS
jgi:hypothetical protein